MLTITLVSLGKSSSAALERLVQQTEALVTELADDGGPGAFINVRKAFALELTRICATIVHVRKWAGVASASGMRASKCYGWNMRESGAWARLGLQFMRKPQGNELRWESLVPIVRETRSMDQRMGKPKA
jgi:hypothetical protein